MGFFFIHAVDCEVSSVILVHAQRLDGVACIAPRALHMDGRASIYMRHLYTPVTALTGCARRCDHKAAMEFMMLTASKFMRRSLRCLSPAQTL